MQHMKDTMKCIENIQFISLILYACVWILIAGCLCKYDMNLYGTLSVDEVARYRSYRD